MSKQREIRDPVHGFIQRNEIEERIIDTSIFQRLRGIKQLAMAYHVYPGALHTRFGHCLGTMHIAGRLAEKLELDSETTERVRLAALLHDIGHGPFSHVSEDLLDRYYDPSKVKVVAKEKIHELLTCQIIQSNREIQKIVGFKCDQIAELLKGIRGESIIHGIISGPIDADKQDYLLRDSYFCGVKYGVFDIERLIATLRSFDDHPDRLLAASSDGVYAIEQFVLAKYHMGTQVYRHRIRLATDAMTVRALELGIEVDGLPWLRELYAYDGTQKYIDNYLLWDDMRLMTGLLYPMAEPGLATELFWRLRERKLFKQVASVSLRDIQDPTARDLLSGIDKTRGLRQNVESEIAEYLSSRTGTSIPAYHVTITGFTLKSVRKQSRNNEGSIIILTAGRPEKFEDVSTLFRSINESESDQFIDVYAPITYTDDIDKKRKQAEFHEKVIEILTEYARQEIEANLPDGKEKQV